MVLHQTRIMGTGGLRMHMELTFTPIDQNQWERGQTFYYFSKMAPTGYSLTVDIDVTNMLQHLKAANLKFFPAYLWLATKCLNEQQEFRIVQKDDIPGYYSFLTPLYATFHEDSKTFSMMWTTYDDDFMTFYESYLQNQKCFGQQRGFLSQCPQQPPENAYTISCVPWISFNHFAVHSYGSSPYYFPSLEAGKFFVQGERTRIPLSITCHHAATDGYHVAKFLETFQHRVNTFLPLP